MTKGWVSEELKMFRKSCDNSYLKKRGYEDDKRKVFQRTEDLMTWQIEAKEDLAELWRYVERFRVGMKTKVEIEDFKDLEKSMLRFALYEDLRKLVDRFEPKFQTMQ